MTIKDLIKHLKTLDQSLDVYCEVYIDRRPLDGEGTDMSGTEEIPARLEYFKVKNYKNGGFVIAPSRWDYQGW